MAVEILAPAGSFESLTAAVRCGANAVYLGGKYLNARRNAANFSEEELQTLRKLVIHTSENLKAAIAEITEHENADDIILNKKG